MRFILALVLLFSIRAQGTVLISSENDWAPWSFDDAEGGAIGRSVDYVRKLFKSVHVRAEFKAVPFSRCLVEAQEGKTLGCFHTAKTPEYLKIFDFPDVPLVEDEVLIYTTVPANEGAHQLLDLKGKKVGVTMSYAYSPEFDALSDIQREESKSDLQTFRKLAGGRLPYVALFKGAAQNLLVENPDLNIKNLRSFSAGKARFYLAFSRSYPQSKRYLKLYNQAAAKFPMMRMHPIAVNIYGDRSYPPYSFLNSKGVPTGIYVELLKEVFATMSEDYDVNLEMVPWSRGLQLLRSGKGLALFPPYKIPARTYIDIYSEPLGTENVAFYCNDASSKTKKWDFPGSFKGLKIGVTQDFVLDRRLAQQFNEKLMERIDVMDNLEGLVQMANKNVDCYVNDSLSVEWAYTQMKKGNHPVLQKFPDFVPNKVYTLSEQEAYLGFATENARFPYKDDFLKKFNKGLRKILSEGKLNEIRNHYLRN